MIETQREPIHVESPETDHERISSDEPYTSVFREALDQARRDKASDIAFEPTAEGLDIRMRVHGLVQTPWKHISIDHRDAFIAKTKRLARLDISVSDKPQDGRMSFPEWKLNIRANLMPCSYGQRLSLRLLDQSREFRLESMGFEEDALKALKTALEFENGVVLISGPTGSGKTTTLYAMLNALDRVRNNVISLEDPVEYELPGVSQAPITKSMSFSEALRAVLRQDPDIILVGEVRDEETADLCFKAASTGHLVLSTIHANDAINLITRLAGLHVNHQLIESNLRFSGAQRLVGKLCPSCSYPMKVDDDLGQRLSLKPASRYRLREKLRPCPSCHDGLIGQIPILQYMLQDEIRRRFRDRDLVTPPQRTISDAALDCAARGLMDTWDALGTA